MSDQERTLLTQGTPETTGGTGRSGRNRGLGGKDTKKFLLDSRQVDLTHRLYHFPIHDTRNSLRTEVLVSCTLFW